MSVYPPRRPRVHWSPGSNPKALASELQPPPDYDAMRQTRERAWADLRQIFAAMFATLLRTLWLPLLMFAALQAPSWALQAIDAHRGALTLLLGLVVGFWASYRLLRKRGELV